MESSRKVLVFASELVPVRFDMQVLAKLMKKEFSHKYPDFRGILTDGSGEFKALSEYCRKQDLDFTESSVDHRNPRYDSALDIILNFCENNAYDTKSSTMAYICVPNNSPHRKILEGRGINIEEFFI